MIDEDVVYMAAVRVKLSVPTVDTHRYNSLEHP
jgi:hypothetical protein